MQNEYRVTMHVYIYINGACDSRGLTIFNFSFLFFLFLHGSTFKKNKRCIVLKTLHLHRFSRTHFHLKTSQKHSKNFNKSISNVQIS